MFGKGDQYIIVFPFERCARREVNNTVFYINVYDIKGISKIIFHLKFN